MIRDSAINGVVYSELRLRIKHTLNPGYSTLNPGFSNSTCRTL